MRRRLRWGAVLLTTMLVMLLTAGTAAYGSTTSPQKSRATSHQGGSLTDLLGAGLFGSWTGFDVPVTTSQSEFEGVVYGRLLDPGPRGTLIPDLATGYKLSNDGLTLTFNLRPGVVFSNGDPFNSSVVAFNMKRSIDPTLPNGAGAIQNWPMSSVDTPDAETVVVHFSHVFAGVLSSIPLNVDPVALQKMGEVAYNLTPVGAGPFMVQSDKPSANLVLKRNPRYWHKGYPKLDTINVETTTSDESAYEAIQSGQVQLYEGLQTLGLVNQAQKNPQTKLYSIPATGTWALQLNTLKPPLNNPLAREALYYATDAAAINKHVFDDKYSDMQSPTGPGGLFYQPKVPGYRTYNLKKAKALVKQLGGLSVNLITVNIPLAVLTDEALESQWKQAGIKTTFSPLNLTAELGSWKAGNWNIITIEAGSYDPATGFGLPLYFGPKTPFSGVHDQTLYNLLDQAQGTFNKTQRAATYKRLFKYLSDQAYMVFLFTVPSYDVTSKNVTGFSTQAGLGLINYQNISVK